MTGGVIRTALRGLLILSGLLIGLALAAVFEGRISHLRQIAGDHLPAWSANLSPDAGLGQGSLRGVRLQGGMGLLPDGPPLDLHWDFIRLGLSGADYNVEIRDAAGQVDLRARVHLGFGAGGFWGGLQAMEFSGGEGEIDLGAIYAAPRDLPLKGRVLLVDAAGVFDGTARRLVRLNGLGSLAEGRFDGFDLGRVRLVLKDGDSAGDGSGNSGNQSDGGAWLADISVSGAALILQAEARGRFDDSVLALTGRIAENPDMPEGWQRVLNQSLSKDGAAWVLPEGMDLQAPGF